MFYDLFCKLCTEKGVAPTRAALDIGLSKSTPTAWKKRQLTPQGDTLNKIADYFGVSVSYLLGQETQKEKPANVDGLTERDKKDIAKNLERLMADLENSGDLMFDGDPASPEAIDSIRNAMAMALEYAKKVNKEKYTPKKYKK